MHLDSQVNEKHRHVMCNSDRDYPLLSLRGYGKVILWKSASPMATRSYANSNEPDAPAVRKSLAAGKPAARQHPADPSNMQWVDQHLQELTFNSFKYYIYL